ncbi:MAG: metal-dependent transcriptional regulator [Clostridia bacterium]|nr:metal-dependent transcriptional regulator [Clostridia bacterium]
MSIRESGEMYLESIFLLLKEHNRVRSVNVAEYTGYKKPSVSRAMGILKQDGLIVIDNDGYISLTESGLALAEKTYQRHRLLTDFFIRIGVPAGVAEADACKIEHVISDETVLAMKNCIDKINLTTGK